MLDELFFGKKINIGQEIIVCGGYDSKRKWGEEEKSAKVLRFVPGQGKSAALLVEFFDPSSFVGYDARYGILELRFAGAQWREGAVCLVEVFVSMPEEKSWEDRSHGKFVESRAIVKIVEKKKNVLLVPPKPDKSK